MGIFIFTEKEASIKKIFPKTAKFSALSKISEHIPVDGDILYIDVSNLTNTELKKTLALVKKNCKAAPWGIIDPKGNIEDTAALFFEGACDYLGPGILKSSGAIDPKRIKEALQWRKIFLKAAGNAVSDEDTSAGGDESASFLSNSIKLPSASTFPGWKKMQTGKAMPFYLLYCSLQGKTSLDARLGEKTIAIIHKKFLALLEDNFYEGDGLLWMNSGKDCLFLLPPKIKCAEAAVKACIRMLVSSPLITIETLNLTMPANFVFALHYGSINYRPPGKTGTAVSDAINFIFHLGTKKAEPGRLIVSGELPGVTIPKALQDCFVKAGEFEGRKIWHTKKFSYAKPWF